MFDMTTRQNENTLTQESNKNLCTSGVGRLAGCSKSGNQFLALLSACRNSHTNTQQYQALPADVRAFLGRMLRGCSVDACVAVTWARALPSGRSHRFSPVSLFTKYSLFVLGSLNSCQPSGKGTQMQVLNPSMRALRSRPRPMKTIWFILVSPSFQGLSQGP